MITNLATFKMDLSNFYNVVTPRNHLRLQVRIAMRLHQLIVYKNSDMPNHPVDTGWARANWGGSLGTPITTVIGSYPGKGKRSGLPIFNLAGVLSQAKPFGIIWIYNNVPYICKLENGHSAQAPQGMVEGALHDLQTFINGLK
jgi:hypothetical protein